MTAATSAPAGSNSRPWMFYAATKSMRDQLVTALRPAICIFLASALVSCGSVTIQESLLPDTGPAPAIRQPGETWRDPLTGMEFVWIPPGTFMMGSPKSEPGRRENEEQHRVTLTKGFYMQTTEVTQAQWEAVFGNRDGIGWANRNCDDCPVDGPNWAQAQDFAAKLGRREGGNTYRLPTEAEWEYAARAGTTTRYSFGDDESWLGEYAWYSVNANRRTHPVGAKKPNPWGSTICTEMCLSGA